jgi:hypothetical protein
MLAVQWHPEAGDNLSLFTSLIEASRQRSSRSAGTTA